MRGLFPELDGFGDAMVSLGSGEIGIANNSCTCLFLDRSISLDCIKNYTVPDQLL